VKSVQQELRFTTLKIYPVDLTYFGIFLLDMPVDSQLILFKQPNACMDIWARKKSHFVQI
jgi:hypothetical protein